MPLMPGAIQVGPIPSTNFSAQVCPKICVVIHEVEGTALSALDEFKDPGEELSAHFIVAGPTMTINGQTYTDGWPDGTILQVLDTDVCAYAQDDGNYPPIAGIAIETAGFETIPMSAAQVVSVAAICAWAASEHGIPLVGPVPHGQPGVTPHCNPDGTPDPSWGDHPCPGLMRLAQIPQIVALANGHAPTPPPEVAVPVAAPIVFAGQFHVLQVSGQSLWHKWSADGEKWGNENVFAAAGVGQPGLPVQVPGVTVGPNLLVAVEDGAGKAWFFKQPPGGPWGVSELP